MLASKPLADVSIKRIDDLLNYQLEELLPDQSKGGTAAMQENHQNRRAQNQ